ncbi:hypothetical protein T9R20_10700 [Microbacterium invictum]|uniref:Uncharacterized protein n=1 Tax=Microbacterium invictum TaxID=515415 RepID=A0ABZ0V6E3_9MICO|nr:hypothetical protein [Microbacterium invictum]WQB69176.1 hypothetical protein T9R20_10700 [Microbacterium invictum]
MTDGISNDEPTVDTPATTAAEESGPRTDDRADAGVQYGVGPFSLREVILGGVWLVAFVVSFFSFSTVQFSSVWTTGLWWILTIGAPTAAVFLLALRRLSPEGIRRVGSLGIDQFASVAFTVSAVIWLHLIWETVAIVVAGGPWLRGWVIWVEFFLMLAGVVLTVFAPLVPALAEDFEDRREIVAHRFARPARPVTPRPRTPRPEKPAAAPASAAAPDARASDTGSYGTDALGVNPYAPASAGAHASAGVPVGPDAMGGTDVDRSRTDETGDLEAMFGPTRTERPEPSGAQPNTAVADFAPADDDTSDDDTVAADTVAHDTAADATAAGGDDHTATTVIEPVTRYQAFWALVPEERDIVDENGGTLFRIGPTAWALVIEDRQTHFVVRHEDGRTGYLHDVSGVTRG